MTRQIKRRERQMALPHRQIKRRSKPDWPYSYNYDDKKFLKYFRSRTGIQVGFEVKRSLSHFLLTDPKADQWLRTSKDYRYLKSKKIVPFGQVREDTIRWHKILRDNLQHWWVIYQKENQPRKIRRR
jgi:hypothetical protein